MPYIEKQARKKYDKHIISLIRGVIDWEDGHAALGSGQMNYIISKLISIYLESMPESYVRYEQMIGLLESTKLELYRTKVSPYEDKAKRKNGIV